MEVVHDTKKNHFRVSLDGADALLEYGESDGMIEFFHTEVPQAHEGKGVGSALAREALEYAKKQGLRVVPTCAFVSGWLERHPEYADLVEED
jgi:predicted GNAT family acetyltransferase